MGVKLGGPRIGDEFRVIGLDGRVRVGRWDNLVKNSPEVGGYTMEGATSWDDRPPVGRRKSQRRRTSRELRAAGYGNGMSFRDYCRAWPMTPTGPREAGELAAEQAVFREWLCACIKTMCHGTALTLEGCGFPADEAAVADGAGLDHVTPQTPAADG